MPRRPSDQIQQLAGNAPLVVIDGEADHAARVLMEAGEGIRQGGGTPSGTRPWQTRLHSGSGLVLGERAAPDSDQPFLRRRGHRAVTVGTQNATVDGGLAAAAPVVVSGATAVIAYNDLVAIGMLAQARPLDTTALKISVFRLAEAVPSHSNYSSNKSPESPSLPRPSTSAHSSSCAAPPSPHATKTTYALQGK